MNLLNIVQGWSKSMGLMDVPAAERVRSIERLKVCAACPNAKESSILRLLKGKGHQLGAIYCNLCGCPVNEKSLVPNEYCPLGQWPGDTENKDFINKHKKQSTK